MEGTFSSTRSKVLQTILSTWDMGPCKRTMAGTAESKTENIVFSAWSKVQENKLFDC